MPVLRKALLGIALVLCASLVFAESVRVKVASANLRASPVSTAKIVGNVKQGKTLDVIEVSGLWTHVTDGKVTGWINNTLIERVTQAPAAPAAKPASPSSVSSSRGTPSRPVARRASRSDKKTLSFGVHGSVQNNTGGIGGGARVLFSPSSSLPSIMAGVEVFPVRDDPFPTLLDVTANAVYVFRSADIAPYVGAGIIHARVPGESSTNFDVMGGMLFKKHLFADARLILAAEGKAGLIVSAGVQF
jgi:hypothetical protein